MINYSLDCVQTITNGESRNAAICVCTYYVSFVIPFPFVYPFTLPITLCYYDDDDNLKKERGSGMLVLWLV